MDAPTPQQHAYVISVRLVSGRGPVKRYGPWLPVGVAMARSVAEYHAAHWRNAKRECRVDSVTLHHSGGRFEA
jgi:hypothetical protein